MLGVDSVRSPAKKAKKAAGELSPAHTSNSSPKAPSSSSQQRQLNPSSTKPSILKKKAPVASNESTHPSARRMLSWLEDHEKGI